ncbi:hypothetical protein DW886_06055 [Enterocloster aldenensis]|nr:hypothetical protein DW886_06055 [Enterocloster aldenensis]
MSKDQADYWPGRPKSRKQPGAGLALESSAEQIRLWNHPQSRFGSGIILGADSAPEPASEQIRPRSHPQSRFGPRISLRADSAPESSSEQIRSPELSHITA